MRHKHVPQRSCVACRQVKPKRALIRVVRSPEGKVLVDETGKSQGRGAYLCRDWTCWQKGIGKSPGSSPLAHSLKVALREEDRVALLDYAQNLKDTVSPNSDRTISET
jgi:predicted RNA-binding protein YlxR (DUF448 family)